MTDRYIRQSAIKKFKRCRRSWMLSYYRNLEPRRDPAAPATGQRDVGTLVHAGVEAHYRGQDPIRTLGQAQVDIENDLRESARMTGVPFTGLSKEWADVFTLAGIMVSGYVDWVKMEGVDADEDTLLIEEQMMAYAGTFHGDDVYLTGRIDRVVKNRHSNMVTIEDTKTVQSLDVGAQLSVDDQLLTYAWLLERAHGIRASEARHNMLRKVKRSASARPPFYGRETIVFNEDQRQNHILHQSAVLGEMVAVMQSIEVATSFHQSVAYPNPTKDCTWDCDHILTCPMMDQGDDWEGFLTNWFQERELA